VLGTGANELERRSPFAANAFFLSTPALFFGKTTLRGKQQWMNVINESWLRVCGFVSVSGDFRDN